MKRYIGIIVLLTLIMCNKNKKAEWVTEDNKIKYSESREKEVWGRVLNGSRPELFYGTELYNLAKAIKDKSSFNNIEKLVNEVSNINLQENKFNRSIGHFTLTYNNLEVLGYLLEKGLNPNLKDKSGRSIMMTINSISKKHLPKNTDILQKMIEHGGDVNIESDVVGFKTPLTTACSSSLENVKILIENGANLNYRYEYNMLGTIMVKSPLNSALLNNKISIVNYLIFEQKVNYSDKHSLKSKRNPGGYRILSYLRNMVFPLGSEKHKQKMKLVNYLYEQGLDYWSTPIPKHIKKNPNYNNKEYLSKY